MEILESGDEGSEASVNRGDLVVAFPQPEHLDGFLVDDERWLLRPGGLVRVALDQGELPRGYYAPIQAIRERDGVTWVYVVEDGGRARELPVRVLESHRNLRRIEAEGLRDGLRLVTKGAHFIDDGDPVTIVDQER